LKHSGLASQPSVLYISVLWKGLKNMIAILTIVHFVICILLVAVVLLQKSKGDGLSGAFGGGGALTASFGNRGAATMLSKATSIFAVLFMATSFLLAIF